MIVKPVRPAQDLLERRLLARESGPDAQHEVATGREPTLGKPPARESLAFGGYAIGRHGRACGRIDTKRRE